MKKQCKRKIWPLLNPLTHAISGAAITPDARLDMLKEREDEAMKAMKSGQGTLRHWQDLVDMNNVCQTMGKSGIGPECLVDCAMAEIELKATAKRYQETGRMGLSGTAIKSLEQVQEWHDLQRKSISRRDFELMVKKTANKIKSRSKDVEEIK